MLLNYKKVDEYNFIQFLSKQKTKGMDQVICSIFMCLIWAAVRVCINEY